LRKWLDLNTLLKRGLKCNGAKLKVPAED
jgi:hypothetical protein